ncbi:hypothetical protein [Blastopirellula marina]|uniref:Leucine Rich repeats (2 copies) n=1 Tax=Blastopirellula marina TaxID=124 RepID=A0A2S8GFB8_9BACT|nr:hypothetical protein [Blastopirellula marina]PQO43113.1 hypothetical protein C5Y93_25725 [Blastopirellula marina]
MVMLLALPLAWVCFAGELRLQETSVFCGIGPATVVVQQQWEHGWPLAFRERLSVGPGSHPLAVWDCKHGDWQLFPLVIDVLAFEILLGVLILAARAPWRLPRRVSLASAIFGVTAICIAFAVIHNMRSTAKREREIALHWQEIGYQVRYEYLGPIWLRKLGLAEQLPWLSRVSEINSLSNLNVSLNEYYRYPELADLSRLRRLDLRSAGMCDEEFVRFAQLRWRWPLEELLISDRRFDGGSFAGCRTMPLLRRVNLSKSGLNDAGFAALAQLRSVEEIDASETKVTVQTVQYALQMPNLRKVNFTNTAIADEDCAPLRQKGVVCETGR